MRTCVALLVAAALPTWICADEVFLKGGGRLSGKITSRTATSVEVDVGAGKIAVPAAGHTAGLSIRTGTVLPARADTEESSTMRSSSARPSSRALTSSRNAADGSPPARARTTRTVYSPGPEPAPARTNRGIVDLLPSDEQNEIVATVRSQLRRATRG